MRDELTRAAGDTPQEYERREYTPVPAYQEQDSYPYPHDARVRTSTTRVAVRGRGENAPAAVYERRRLSVDNGGQTGWNGSTGLNKGEQFLLAFMIALGMFGFYFLATVIL